MAPPSASASAASAEITPALAEFLESGLIMYLATRTATLKPNSVMCAGLRVEAPTTVTLFLPEHASPGALADLADNGEMALTLVKVTDARAVQLKGTLSAVAPASAGDHAFQESYRARLAPEMAQAGLPLSVTARFVFQPCRALTMHVRDLFLQTPGPGAGRRLEPGAQSLLRPKEARTA
jgi:hypothetical protein